ncbi:peptidoglycan D,D-transpeptidase FtsI family protein [Seleniivibrio woodruffii]|uniref:Peptidoglycan synthetase FtsI n=1 Tax=Seleniivibrio woodruffii TaxID=1078050 RepID=A0A4R1K2H1_9BACT|nr:penicillin-binding protein 2 [Seleniivibrio woodruffii]TCK58215.1 peptidoglycan synthetase FtsI [Seleniivibrio woodruffii]TVZ35680.1 cell division protein FtsI (penicillin-binding protein 3) [Seleniivibrio woodruffii]
MLKTENSRLTFFSWFAVFIFCLMGAKVVYLQTAQNDFYAGKATRQSKGVMESTKGRGLILDANGSPLALNKKSASLYVFPEELKNRQAFIDRLRREGIKISAGKKRRIMNGKGFVWITRNVEVADAKRIQEEIPEIEYVLEEQRFYPERKLAASIVGFTGIDNEGLNGVEYRYNDVLEGSKFQLLAMRDNKGKRIIFEDPQKKKDVDTVVYLTIDEYLQGLSEEILRQDTAEFMADKGMAIAMDAQTGEIIFAASSGGFDPNEFRKSPQSEWKNYPASFLYEPGSIFKPVLFSLLLDKHNLNTNRAIDCENGMYTLYGHTIKDVSKSGILSVEQVLIKSSNIGMVKLSDGISKKEFYEYIKSLGFGDKTGISGVIEEEGLVRNYKRWSGLSKPSISIGQEILVTPLQMVRFYGAIANGGMLMNPKIVKKVEKGGETFTPKNKEERVFSEATAKRIQGLLEKVVKEGTGKNAYSDYVEIGGKTGTGQRIDTETGTYSKTGYVASFAGVFPADNPKIAMVVVYKEPKSSIYGGVTAARTFRSLAEQVSMHLGLKRSYVYESVPTS